MKARLLGGPCHGGTIHIDASCPQREMRVPVPEPISAVLPAATTSAIVTTVYERYDNSLYLHHDSYVRLDGYWLLDIDKHPHLSWLNVDDHRPEDEETFGNLHLFQVMVKRTLQSDGFANPQVYWEPALRGYGPTAYVRVDCNGEPCVMTYCFSLPHTAPRMYLGYLATYMADKFVEARRERAMSTGVGV